MAAPALAGSPVEVAWANTTSISATAPEGREPGDILIFGYWLDAEKSPSEPSGWTLLGSFGVGEWWTERLYLRVADGTEADNFSGGWEGNAERFGEMFWVVGADPLGAATAKVGTAASGSSNKATAPGVTTDTAENLILGFFNAGGAFTVKSLTGGWTAAGEWAPLAHKEQAVAGETGNLEVEFTAAAEWACRMIALQPPQPDQASGLAMVI